MKYREHHGLMFAVTAACLSAAVASLVRWTDSVPIWTLIFFRFLIGSFAVIPWIYEKKGAMTLQSFKKHLGRSIFGLIAMTSFFYSIINLPLMNAVTFLNSAPLFLPVILFFWHKKIVPMTRVIAIMIGFMGVVIILKPSPNIPLQPAFIGVLCGASVAIVQTMVRHLSKTESTESVLAHFFVTCTVFTFFPMLFFWENFEDPWLWMNILLIAILSLCHQFCFTRALGIAKATKVGSILYLSVPISGLLGWWFFQEIPSITSLVGTAFIVCGGVVAILSKKEAAPRKR